MCCQSEPSHCVSFGISSSSTKSIMRILIAFNFLISMERICVHVFEFFFVSIYSSSQHPVSLFLLTAKLFKKQLCNCVQSLPSWLLLNLLLIRAI